MDQVKIDVVGLQFLETQTECILGRVVVVVPQLGCDEQFFAFDQTALDCSFEGFTNDVLVVVLLRGVDVTEAVLDCVNVRFNDVDARCAEAHRRHLVS